MSRFALHLTVCAAGLLCSPGSGQAAPTSGDRPPATAVTQAAPVAPTARPRQLAPEVQQDPAARVMRLQQLRLQIVNRIKALDEERYRRVVRPSLDAQLRRLGFDEQDVTYFLTDLDRTRDAR